MGSPTAPHPVLKKYYESESERRPFVRALFDDAAEHYDWVCALGSFGSGQRGMLREARRTLSIPLVQGTVEELPFANNHFDFLSMGYALRHMAGLDVAFGECLRVLKPGGRVLILEITLPSSRLGQRVFRVYFEKVLPRIARISTGSAKAELLMKYYWDTIAGCVPPDMILGVLKSSGFIDVERRVLGGLLSEYLGRKPVPDS